MPVHGESTSAASSENWSTSTVPVYTQITVSLRLFYTLFNRSRNSFIHLAIERRDHHGRKKVKQWTSDFLQITFNPRFESSYKFFTRCALYLVRREIKEPLSIYLILRTFRELVDQYLLRVHAPLSTEIKLELKFFKTPPLFCSQITKWGDVGKNSLEALFPTCWE